VDRETYFSLDNLAREAQDSGKKIFVSPFSGKIRRTRTFLKSRVPGREFHFPPFPGPYKKYSYGHMDSEFPENFGETDSYKEIKNFLKLESHDLDSFPDYVGVRSRKTFDIWVIEGPGRFSKIVSRKLKELI